MPGCCSLCFAVERIFTAWCCELHRASPLSTVRTVNVLFWRRALFGIFRRVNKKKLQVRAADPFLALYMRSEYEIRQSTKIKMRRYIQPFECILLHQTAAAVLSALFLSATRIFYLYALGVSSAMLKKVAWSHQKTRTFWKCGKTFAVFSKHKPSPRCTGLLDQCFFDSGLDVLQASWNMIEHE